MPPLGYTWEAGLFTTETTSQALPLLDLSRLELSSHTPTGQKLKMKKKDYQLYF